MKPMYMIGNAHLDPVWLWQWRDGYHEAMATFRSALDRLNETPDFVFTCACACYYEWVEENDPAMFEEIRRRVDGLDSGRNLCFRGQICIAVYCILKK